MSPDTRGFTLPEVVIALVIAQATLFGTLGMFTLAARQLSRAHALEEALTQAHSIADSLADGAAVGQGIDSTGANRIIWTVDTAGNFVITVLAQSGDSLAFEGKTRR